MPASRVSSAGPRSFGKGEVRQRVALLEPVARGVLR